MNRSPKRNWLTVGLASLVLLGFAASGQAATIGLQVNNYAFGLDPAAVIITSRVDNQGSFYLWEYTVQNQSYDPTPGTTNGFSGFELNLPGGFVADLGNVTNPSAGWENNCCSGLPMEWDIRDTTGLGIMPGSSGIFSFTTLPRSITTANDGWFHTWAGGVQTDLVFYGADNAPFAPDLLTPIPEPATLLLFGTTAAGLGLARWRRRHRP
jgi:hypothetical protein